MASHGGAFDDCVMGLPRTTSPHRVIFVSLAMLLAVGCYKKEAPEGADAGTIADTSASSGATDGLGEAEESADGSESDDPSQEGSAEQSDPDDTGGDDDPSGGNDGSALEPLIGSLCEWEFRCCSDGERDYRLGPFTVDAADCSDRFVQQLGSNDDKPELQ